MVGQTFVFDKNYFGPKFSFNQNKQLINKNGEIYCIIHQYDRCFKEDGSAVFNFEKIYD